MAEASFPRGGRAAMSGLEYRHIKQQAEADAGAEVAADTLFGTAASSTTPAKGKGKRKKRTASAAGTPTAGAGKRARKGEAGSGTKRAATLAAKRLAVGTKVLAAVREVQELFLGISLPNGLSAIAKLADISEPLALELQGETTEATLVDHFAPGQLVIATVSKTHTDGNGRHRIEVALDPARVNAGIQKSHILAGQLLACRVESVEDHGCVVSFGVEGIKGFLQKSRYAVRDGVPVVPQPHQYLVCSALAAPGSKRSIKVAATAASLQTSVLAGDALTLASCAPGNRVSGVVTAALDNGVEVQFNGFKATVHCSHLPRDLNFASAETLPLKTKVSGRILFAQPDSKTIALTLHEALVDFKTMSSPTFTIGETHRDAVVARVDAATGIYLQLGEGLHGFAHISRLSDTHTAKIPKKFSVGSKHTCRVVAASTVDNLALVSLQKRVIDMPFLGYDDVKAGETVSAEVLTLEPFGLIVSLSDNIRALCPTLHLADVRIKHPELKFVPGKKIKCRVLSNYEKGSRKRIAVTHKKTLVQSELPLITSYATTEVGTIAHGFVSEIKPAGCIVEFFNNIRGLVPLRFLHPTTRITDPEEFFKVGQVVKCLVLAVQPERSRMQLSFDLKAKLNKADADSTMPIDVGSTIDVVVKAVGDTDLTVETTGDSPVTAQLKNYHLSDHPVMCKNLGSTYKPGDVIRGVLLLALEHGRPVLTAKPALKAFVASNEPPATFAGLEQGMELVGFVRSATSYGVFVGLPHGLVGLAPSKQLGFKAPDPTAVFTTGQTVRVQVTKLDKASSQVFLSLTEPTPETTVQHQHEYLTTLFKDAGRFRAGASKAMKRLRIGDTVSARITAVHDAYMVAQVGDVGAVITARHFGADKLHANDVVNARVLDVDFMMAVVDLSLREDLLPTAGSEAETGAPEAMKGRIELIKEDRLAISFGNAKLGFATVSTLNDRRPPFDRFKAGQTGACTLLSTAKDRTLLSFAPRGRASKKAKKETVHPRADELLSAFAVGQVASATITKVQKFHLNLAFANGATGRVHICEMPYKKGQPAFGKHKAGETVKAVILGLFDAKTHSNLPITQSTRHSILECSLKGKKKKKQEPLDVLNLEGCAEKVGQKIAGFVQAVEDDCLWVCISPIVRGRISALQASRDAAKCADLQSSFAPGDRISCEVLAVDVKKRTLDLGAAGLAKQPQEGTKVAGTIARKVPKSGLVVRLAHGWTGFVAITDIADSYKQNPLGSKALQPKATLEFFVLRVLEGEQKADLSLRPSRLGNGGAAVRDPEVTCFEDVKVDEVYRGYIRNVSDDGCFVSLGSSVTARVRIDQLSDLFVKDFKAAFSKGTLVRGRVLQKDAKRRRVELSLKESVVDPSKHGALTLDTLTEGLKTSGQVKSVESYGVFVGLSNSKLSGMCHISEASDVFIKDLKAKFSEGDLVKVTVLKIDPETKRISLGMKQSYFPEDMDSAEDADPEAAEVEEEREAEVLDDEAEAMAADEGDAPTLSLEDAIKRTLDANAVGAAPAGDSAASDAADDADVAAAANIDDEMISVITRKRKRTTEPGSALQVDAGFWSVPAATEEADEEAGDTATTADGRPARLSKRAKRAAKIAEEELIKEAEAAQLNGEGIPNSADAFDRALMASPNDSHLWVRYIAFHLQMTEVDKARDVALRALKRISFRQQTEKLNVWIARLNLENTYGTPETLEAVFKEAALHNDPEQIYFQLVRIYDNGGNFEAEDALFKRMCKKFNTNKRVWVAYGHFKMRQGLTKQARQVLDRALLSLAKHDHIDTIVKFALMEFRLGDTERARTIFESVLANYPKRVDLWSVFIDQELRVGDHEMIRQLFDRVTSLTLSSKKMKYFFKRYLEFEKTEGDDGSVEAVKAKARAFVDAKIQSA